MTDTPPDWAFQRAQELRTKRGFTHLDAFAAYIAEHEHPPVDLLAEALSEIDRAAMSAARCANELRAAIEARGGKIVWGDKP